MPNSSPLKNLSHVYTPTTKVTEYDLLSSNYRSKRIIDDPENHILYIIPAGFSQRINGEKHRSEYYRAIWEQCVYLQTENELFPLGKEDHLITLVKEPENRHDPYAIKIGIEFKQEVPEQVIPGKFKRKKWQDIGYIPKVISKTIHQNIDNIKKGHLINIYAESPKNIYFGRVALFYGEEHKIVSVDHSNQRFAAILEE